LKRFSSAVLLISALGVVSLGAASAFASPRTAVPARAAQADAVKVARADLTEFSGYKKSHTEPDGTFITEELSNPKLAEVRPCQADRHLNEEFGTSLVCIALYKAIYRQYTPTQELNDEIIYSCPGIGIFGPFDSRPKDSAQGKVFPIKGGAFITVGRLKNENWSRCPKAHRA
jgi:hypothetical protein